MGERRYCGIEAEVIEDAPAERSKRGDGRVYTVFFEVADRQGNRTTASCKVGVPICRFRPPVDSGMASCVGSGCRW